MTSLVIRFGIQSPSQRILSHKNGKHRTPLSQTDTHQRDPQSKTTQIHKKHKNKAPSRSLKHTPKISPIKWVQFETTSLSEEEKKSFFQRRYEPSEATRNISGLEIDRDSFRVNTANELPQRLSIPLPGEETKQFSLNFSDFKHSGSFVWIGTTKNPLETLHLSSYNLTFVGQIETPKTRYEIKYLSKNKHIIREVDRSYFPEDPADGIAISDDATTTRKTTRGGVPSKATPQDLSDSATPSGAPPYLEDTVSMVIDLIVGYSHLIEEAEGSADATQALLNLHISGVNTSHRNSNTGLEFHVTATIEVQARTLNHLGENLERLLVAEQVKRYGGTYQANDPYHVLINKRHETHSDLATLITEKFVGTTCGKGYILPKNITSSASFQMYGLSVLGANCSMDVLSHEIGHNLGCNHDRGIYPSDSPFLQVVLPYAFGFSSQDESHIRTIMYSGCALTNCQRLLYFSDPDKRIQNIFIGKDNLANNTRSIRERAHIVRDIFPELSAGDTEPTEDTTSVREITHTEENKETTPERETTHTEENKDATPERETAHTEETESTNS